MQDPLVGNLEQVPQIAAIKVGALGVCKEDGGNMVLLLEGARGKWCLLAT